MTGPRIPGRVALGDWTADAACLGQGSDLWFSFPSETRKRNAAIAVCERCPVRVECLAHALENDEPFGIWGGKDERQRRAIRNRLLDRQEDDDG